MAQVNPDLIFEMQFSGSAGAWTDITSDVIAKPKAIARYGINGTGPLDRVAATGTLQFRLRNDAGNSGGLEGYYSPEHSNARSGFDLGAGVRLRVDYSGSTIYKWRGELANIEPAPGRYRSRQTLCGAVDWMDVAGKRKMRLEGVALNQRADEGISTIVGNMIDKPAASSLASGQDAFPTIFDSTRDEGTTVARELFKLTMSELGYLYVVGDQITGGVLTFEDRHARPKYGAAAASLNDILTRMISQRTTRKIFNRVKTQVYPRETDSGSSVLFDLQSTPLVPSSGSILVEGRYTDPDNRGVLRVGGASMINPVSGSDNDFSMNSASDGAGTDRTSDFTVTASYGGNSVRYGIDNGGGNSSYVTKLRARGTRITIKEPTLTEKSDDVSISTYGESVLRANMSYQEDALVAEDVSNSLLGNWKDPANLFRIAEFAANESDALMQAALLYEPGDKITITETLTGIDADFFINGVELTLTAPDMLKCRWVLVPTGSADFWILGIVGSSELDASTKLGY